MNLSRKIALPHSSVLDLIFDWAVFFTALQAVSQASRYLIRITLYERDWQRALRRIYGVDFRSDYANKNELTLVEFQTEMSEAGLSLVELQTIWGEILADYRRVGDDAR